jgi:predicted amidohydrolase YtcJ
MHRKLAIIFLSLSLLLAACQGKTDGVIYTAQQIVTMDPSTPQAQAVYVLDGKIQQVGSVEQLVTAHPSASKDATFAQQTLIPGLIDPHVHMILGAMIYSRPFVPPWDMETPNGVVKGLPSKQALLDRLKQLDQELDASEPLIAYGDHN